MPTDVLCSKYFCDILITLKQGPKSYNEIKSKLKISPHTLNRRIKELTDYELIKPILVRVEGENRIKYEITDRGKEALPLIEEFIDLSDAMGKLVKR
ncbi:MAG: winged helix-turn-helix transcriptional regulator [Methanocellales archaeon]|nr:winged helix-turn-helix transcriptional regulator [Methanocellales archaeon]